MDAFTQSLRAQLEKATGQAPPWGDVNPLVVIGLTEAILDLGLTEDQIYSVIRSYRRQLAAQVHPDRNPANFSPKRQKQILGAFDLLDDRQNFSRALAHFKTLRSEDRRETKILGQALTALRQQLSGFESQFDALKTEKEQLSTERQEYERLKLEEPLVVPNLQELNKNQGQRIGELERVLRDARSSTSTWKTKFGHGAGFISALGTLPEKSSSIFVFDAQWVVVVSLWHPESSPPTPFDESNKVTAEFAEAILAANMKKKQLKLVLQKWEEAVKKFGDPDKLERKILPLSISIIKLDAGKPTLIFGNRIAAQGGRIIGSLPPDKLPMHRSRLINTVAQDDVFATLSPFLVPGGLLVSVTQETIRRASWSLICPAFKFTTKRFILAVG